MDDVSDGETKPASFSEIAVDSRAIEIKKQEFGAINNLEYRYRWIRKATINSL